MNPPFFSAAGRREKLPALVREREAERNLQGRLDHRGHRMAQR
jgi:hypothetical protein